MRSSFFWLLFKALSTTEQTLFSNWLPVFFPDDKRSAHLLKAYQSAFRKAPGNEPSDEMLLKAWPSSAKAPNPPELRKIRSILFAHLEQFASQLGQKSTELPITLRSGHSSLALLRVLLERKLHKNFYHHYLEVVSCMEKEPLSASYFLFQFYLLELQHRYALQAGNHELRVSPVELLAAYQRFHCLQSLELTCRRLSEAGYNTLSESELTALNEHIAFMQSDELLKDAVISHFFVSGIEMIQEKSHEKAYVLWGLIRGNYPQLPPNLARSFMIMVFNFVASHGNIREANTLSTLISLYDFGFEKDVFDHQDPMIWKHIRNYIHIQYRKDRKVPMTPGLIRLMDWLDPERRNTLKAYLATIHHFSEKRFDQVVPILSQKLDDLGNETGMEMNMIYLGLKAYYELHPPRAHQTEEEQNFLPTYTQNLIRRFSRIGNLQQAGMELSFKERLMFFKRLANARRTAELLRLKTDLEEYTGRADIQWILEKVEERLGKEKK